MLHCRIGQLRNQADSHLIRGVYIGLKIQQHTYNVLAISCCCVVEGCPATLRRRPNVSSQQSRLGDERKG
jgi:hypothetical protein